MSGLVLISLPKSGTHFLSQYLASLTGYRYRYGLWDHMLAPDALAKALAPADPHIAAALDEPEDFTTTFLDVYRTRLYPQAQEKTLDFGHWIIADHAFQDLTVFVRNPERAQLLTPEQVRDSANKRRMGVLYLYREDIRDVVTSMAHFISSGATRFLKLTSLETAITICIEKHLPMLARQLRLWKASFDGMKVSYESLNRDTHATIVSVCRRFNLPHERGQVISSMGQYKTCGFRKGGMGDFKYHLRQDQLEYIKAVYPDLCPDR